MIVREGMAPHFLNVEFRYNWLHFLVRSRTKPACTETFIVPGTTKQSATASATKSDMVRSDDRNSLF